MQFWDVSHKGPLPYQIMLFEIDLAAWIHSTTKMNSTANKKREIAK